MKLNPDKSSPLVSVIVPSYNHENYIEQCISSIVNQTYKNIELIVIDDGSKDNSRTLIRHLSEIHKFKYIEQTNRGSSATLNRGIQEFATGEYIACLASDDWWELDKIATQVEFYLRNPEAGFIFGNAYIVDKVGKIQEKIIEKRSVNLSFESLLRLNTVPALTVMMRRDVFFKLGGFDEKLAIEDWDLWLRIAYEYPFAYIDKCLAYYRMHGSNISANHLKMIEEEKKVLHKWSRHPFFKSAYNELILREIAVFAVLNKRKAVAMLLKRIDLIFNISYYKSWVKIFVKHKM